MYSCKAMLFATREAHNVKYILTIFLLLLLIHFPSCTPTGIGQSRYVNSSSIHNYQPRSNLGTDKHHVEKARYSAVDIHCHWGLDQDPEKLIEAMDQRGIQQAVNLSGDWGLKLEQILTKFHGYAPDRFIIFCSPDFNLIDQPDFGQRMEKFLANAHAKGARGVKIYKNLGLRIKDKSGKLVPVDDPRLDPIWAKAGNLGMPVLIHTADPAAFFKPTDRFNERWLQLERRPNWSFHDTQYPSRSELLAQRNRVIARHTNTIFIGAHVANNAEDLRSVGTLMDQFDNLYVDIAGRVAELGRQPYSARQFFITYQDRILFGTDRFPGRPDQPRYRIYFRFLETMDEYFDYYDHPFPPTGEWKIYGIGLSDKVLEKIYTLNAQGIFK